MVGLFGSAIEAAVNYPPSASKAASIERFRPSRSLASSSKPSQF